MLCSYFRALIAEPNILGHALSKVEVVSDSKLESNGNSVEGFGESDISKTCSKGEMSIVIVTSVHGIRPYQDDCLAPPTYKQQREDQEQEDDEDIWRK